ncbi:MAG: DUF4395 domain-containing protein [Campylobacterales bacterium]|nr:DUF4395 domain-containing protein [Campylobacterales bacterium]
MSQACPLLFRQIDAMVVKVSASLVMGGVILYLITSEKGILVFLIIDFLIRLSGYKKFSPIFALSTGVQTLFKLPVRMEDAGAKRLAAFFGLFFMNAMLVMDLEGWNSAIFVVATTFIGCVFLDLFFNYCIACKIYSYGKKIYPKRFV